jgi:hypothetical protein
MLRATAAGYVTKHDVTYEQMKKFIDEDQYTVHTPTTYHVKLELNTFDKLLPLFFKRMDRASCAREFWGLRNVGSSRLPHVVDTASERVLLLARAWT